MQAKFNTTCKKCWKPIAQGTEIQKNSDGVWVHEECLLTPTVTQTTVAPKILPNAKDDECKYCGKKLPEKGDTYFYDDAQVCMECFDADIKRRNNSDPTRVPFW